MKLAKRIMALLLALLMLPIWNPVTAQAIELPSTGKTETGHVPAWVNPLYADIYTADDFDRPELPEHSPGEINTNATYVSMTQGIKQFRDYMKKRNETFTIYVKTTNSDVNDVANTLFNGALEHTGIPTEGDYLQWQWATAEVSYTRSYSGGEYQYTLDFGFTYYTTAAQEKKVDTAVQNLISSLGVSGKSDYNKIRAVYDYMCDNITYDYENLYDEGYTQKFTAYAALIDKTAVCQGYALLFYRLMLELGIDSRLIAGIGGGGAHGWNIVELNGLYYNVDSTWDAGMSDYSYFLTSTWNFLDHYRYLDYETWEFHEEYPMAAEDYVSGVAGEVDPYIYIDYCGDEAIFVLERDGTLTIGGNGAIWDYYPSDSVEDDASPWHYWNDHVTKLVVEDGITALGEAACYDMDALKSVKLPTSLRTIGWWAFDDCEALGSVTIPEGVTVIHRGAFQDSSITEVSLPSTLVTIDSEVFRDCGNLKTVTIPASVTSIGSFAFGSCDSLQAVYFQGDAPVLEAYLFENTETIAYYPAGNETWTEDVLQDYYGDITWVPQVSAPEIKVTNAASTGKPKVSWEAVPGAVKYEVYRSTSKSGTYKRLSTITGTSLTNSSAEVGVTYYYKVRCVDEAGRKTEFSNIVSRTCDLPRPTVTLSNIASSGKIKITWEKIDGAVKYEVYRSTDNKTWSKLSTVTGTSLTNSSAETGKLYYYKVRAIHEKSGANSAYSTVKSRRCDVARPTITLTNIASSGKIKIDWEKMAGATKYEVYYSTDNANWSLLKTTTGTYLNHNSAEAGKLYYYKVRAIASNSAANSAFSSVKSRRCDLPQPVVTLTSIPATGKIKITWNAIAGAVRYQVHRSTDNVNWTRLSTVTGTSLTNTSVEVGKTYYYKVFAVASNSAANSAYSEVHSMTCTLAQPTLTVKLNSKNLPYLTWSKVTGASKYVVYRSTDNAAWTKLYTTTGTSLTNSSVEPGNTYYYKVQAIASDSAANSVCSAVAQVRTPAALAIIRQPESVTVAEGGQLVLEVEAVGDELTYVWYCKPAGGDTFAPLADLTGNHISIPMTKELDGCQIYCGITDQYGNCIQTDVITVTMAAPPVTEESVQQLLAAMQAEYPEGTPWTDNNVYAWNGGIFSEGSGCAAFAFLISDLAFGDLPARMSEAVSIDVLRVGDILRVNGDTHSVIVLEVHEDHIVIAEGNFNGTIHWGRTLSAEEVTAADYFLTRYPE